MQRPLLGLDRPRRRIRAASPGRRPSPGRRLGSAHQLGAARRPVALPRGTGRLEVSKRRDLARVSPQNGSEQHSTDYGPGHNGSPPGRLAGHSGDGHAYGENDYGDDCGCAKQQAVRCRMSRVRRRCLLVPMGGVSGSCSASASASRAARQFAQESVPERP